MTAPTRINLLQRKIPAADASNALADTDSGRILPHPPASNVALNLEDNRAAEIQPCDVVAVMGCGPVGLFAIMSAFLLGAGRVLAVDHHQDRLAKAHELGAEVIDFSREDAVQTLQDLTGDSGPDRVIDAVGIDAQAPEGEEQPEQQQQIAPDQNPDGDLWHPGNAPMQALEAFEAFDRREPGWVKVALRLAA